MTWLKLFILTVSLSGPFDARANGVYEFTGSRWVQMIRNPAPLRVKTTYWFFPARAPDGSILFGVMNATGYHVWCYRSGRWSDLGLKNQRVERLFVLPNDIVFAVTDAYVCWVRRL